jgi:uncharacterized protein involved in exopolysaccharide biosynthesis
MHVINKTLRTTHVRSEPDIVSEQQGRDRTPEPHFEQLMEILRRRHRLVLTTAALGTILAGVAGLLITPKYTAKAQIVIEPQAATLVSPEAVQQVIDTHLTMLTSAYHLQHVLESLRSEPAFRAGESQTNTAVGASASSVEGDARLRAPATATAPAEPVTAETGPLSWKELNRRLRVWINALPWNTAARAELTFDDLDRRLKVMQERRSRVITIRFQWTSPQKAAAIANRIANLYIQSNLEQQRLYSNREMARLEERMTTIKEEIQGTSAALQEAIQPRTDANQSEQEAAVIPSELGQRAASSAQLYANLLQRQKEIRAQEELIKPDASILSLASPPARPSSPNPILFMLPALIASLIFGSLLAVLLQRFDRGLRSGREINDALGMTCIGLVPHVARKRLTHLAKFLLAEPFSPYAEAIRAAVAVLRLAEPGLAAKVFLISSSFPKEGKTTLALSIAIHVASLGRRVLLLDFDCRRDRELDRKVETGVANPSQPYGLHSEAIKHIGDVGLHYRPMPRCGDDPLAMFAQGRVLPLLRELRDTYDTVIIDGPPVLGTSETRLLASMVDRVVFVVKWGSTMRDSAREALNQLRGSPGFDVLYTDLPVGILTHVNRNERRLLLRRIVGEWLRNIRQIYSRKI